MIKILLFFFLKILIIENRTNINNLKFRNYQKRKVAIVENESWNPKAEKL